MTPLIGLTTRLRTLATSGGEVDNHTLNHTYTDSVVRAGGTPIMLAPVPAPMIPGLLDRVDGLVLTGGGDVDPTRYGGTEHASMYGIDFDRDAFELDLVHEAAVRHMPVLAICRGLQVVNVAFGGTLIEDIPTEVGSTHHSVRGAEVYNGHQRVKVEDSCRVGLVVGTSDLMVNSIHHQAVRQLAEPLRAVAWADDGVVEAVEHENAAWPLLAVQWHPEYLGDNDDDASHRLFDALISAAGERSTG